MRRPILNVFLMISIGIIFEYYFKLSLLYIVFFSAISFLIFSIRNFKRHILFIVIGMVILNMQSLSLIAMDNRLGETSLFEGIASFSKIEDGMYDKKKLEFTINQPDSGNILVTYYFSNEEYKSINGKLIKVHGILEKPNTQRNPKCFDYRKHLSTRGVGYTLKADSIIVSDEFTNPVYKLANDISILRDNFLNYLDKSFEKETAGFIKAMMFGIKDQLGEEVYDEFQKNGTAHILATSGLHIGIIFGSLVKLFKIERNKIKSFIAILFFIAYIIMADCSFSIMRAVILIIISMGGKLFHQRVDLLTSLSLSGIILTLISPMAIFNSGFQMSFLAVFVLGVTNNKLSRFYIKNIRVKNLLPVFIIQLVMSPYIAYNFNYFSFSSFLANIPVTFIAAYLLPIGMASFIVFVFLGFVPDIVLKIISFVTKSLININEYTYLDGILSFDVISPPLIFVLIFYGLFFMFTNDEIIICYMRKKFKSITLVFMAIIIFMCSISSFEYSEFNKAKAIFLDVGQGCCMIFKGRNGKTLMIDGGGNTNYKIGIKTVKPFLLKNGIKKIDIALVTHLDSDHYLGVKELAIDGKIKKLALYDGNKVIIEKISKETGIDYSNFIFLKKHDVLKIDDDLIFETIGPNGGSMNQYLKEIEDGDENTRSLVGKVHLDAIKFMITGDIDINTEEKLIGNMKSDIIQVPHHGSKDSSSDYLLNNVKPRAAVFQVGKNNYGHPAGEIIEKYNKNDIIIKRNDLDGAVGVLIKDGSFEFIEMINLER